MTEERRNVADIEEHAFPEGLLELLQVSDAKSPCDGLIVLLHTFLLEVGYISKDVQNNEFSGMPENWNIPDFSKIHYFHKSLPEATCWVTCVPLCGRLTIQGTVESEKVEDSVHWTFKIDAFLNNKGDLSNPSSLFTHVKELSCAFKDGFCYPLLSLLQESMNQKPTFGLGGLIGEVKTVILKLLPVESVVALSSVNKDFHNQASLPYLWKHLFLRDYGLLGATGSSSSEDWREKYKEEYQRRRARPTFRPFSGLYHPYYIPQIFPVGPSFNPDYGINMDPALQEAFPLMRSRFRPSNWFFPNGFNYFN